MLPKAFADAPWRTLPFCTSEWRRAFAAPAGRSTVTREEGSAIVGTMGLKCSARSRPLGGTAISELADATHALQSDSNRLLRASSSLRKPFSSSIDRVRLRIDHHRHRAPLRAVGHDFRQGCFRGTVHAAKALVDHSKRCDPGVGCPSDINADINWNVFAHLTPDARFGSLSLRPRDRSKVGNPPPALRDAKTQQHGSAV